jgi:Protein of unknown function (DUF2961)
MRLFPIALLASCALAQLPSSLKTFGTGVSQGVIDHQERSLFQYKVSAGSSHAVMTHFWITGGPSIDTSVISYYLDGESTPSIQFQPALACGTWWDYTSGVPWSTDYISKEATGGGWSMRIRVPFQQSINITYRSFLLSTKDTIYMIVRGTENLPITIGGIQLPTTARLQLQKNNVTLKPLEFLTVGSSNRGTRGAFFMFTLAFYAPNLNTLEGCPHFYVGDQQFPGLIVATGTEDAFNSAYYYSAGEYRGNEAGLTHISFAGPNYTNATLSTYRIYDRDPLYFDDGFQYVWRNGDVTDPATGLKCTSLTGSPVGNPQTAQVITYGWSYYWA